jgi:hypothetical protein
MTAPRSRRRAGARRSAAIAGVAPPARRRLVFFFDLDDTLHDASHAIFRQIDTRMTDYVERHLDVDRGEANRLRTLYWHRYGATLLGLVRHHAVDAAHFLRETHDFDVAALVRAERGLTRLFARLPGRKVLLTALLIPVHDREDAAARHVPAQAFADDAAGDARARARARLAGCPRRGQRRQPEGGPRDRIPDGADDRTRNPDCRGAWLHAAPPGEPCRPRDPIAAPAAARSRAPAPLRLRGRPR